MEFSAPKFQTSVKNYCQSARVYQFRFVYMADISKKRPQNYWIMVAEEALSGTDTY